MGWTYEIDAERLIYVVKFSGVVSETEFVAAFRRAYQEAQHDSRYAEVVDFSLADRIEATGAALQEIAGIAAGLPKELRPTRLAVIVVSDYGYGMARAYGAWAEESGVPLRIFRKDDLEAAYLWASSASEP